MRHGLLRTMLWALAVVLAAAARGQAQPEAGTVAAMQGRLEVQRGGTWRDAQIGTPVFVGDRLRTGVDDRAKIVFRDDGVVDLAPNTELLLDKQTFDPAGQQYESLLRLFKGKIRAWVSDYYREPNARYEVETVTAVAGVRGTEFIVLYDVGAELTEVVGIADEVEVVGKLAVIGRGVVVGPQLYTQVRKGRFPTAPERLDETRFRQYLLGLDILGTGRRDGLNVLHPAVTGRLLTTTDVPPDTGAAPGAEPAGLTVGAPDEFLAEQLSPDIRTNTQPLLDYQQVPPGVPPSGGVRVEF